MGIIELSQCYLCDQKIPVEFIKNRHVYTGLRIVKAPVCDYCLEEKGFYDLPANERDKFYLGQNEVIMQLEVT